MIIGKNAKIIPKVWHIFMYLLFKNFSFVILFQLIISNTYIKKANRQKRIVNNNNPKNDIPTPNTCSVLPTMYVIYNSGKVKMQNKIKFIQPQTNKKLKLYRFLNLSKNISKSYKKTKGKTMIISN